MPDAFERLKILLDSSTPIVVMETVEEMRAVRLVRAGLLRCGNDIGEVIPDSGPISGGHAAGNLGHQPGDTGTQAVYNSREPAQALGNLEAMTLEAAFRPQRLSSPHGRPGRSAPAA